MGMSTPGVERDTVSSIIAVLSHIREYGTYTSHDTTFSTAISRVWECYDGPQFDISPDDITGSDVEITYRFLKEHSPTRDDAETYRAEHGTAHPNKVFTHCLDFVDTASRYYTGCLPSFRTWTAKYVLDGTVIAERSCDFEDSIKLTPIIDGVRYKANSTARDADGTVRVSVSQRPARTDIDVFINRHRNHTVTVAGHNGPNVTTETHPVSVLENEFDPERRDDTTLLVDEPLEDVVEFVEAHGWEYEADDELQLHE